LAIILIPMVIFIPKASGKVDDPWANVPERKSHVDHTSLIEGPFESPSEVTQRCLECHPEAGTQMLESVHWTWESQEYNIEGRPEPVTVGKKTSLNNFCIGIQSNWPGCTSCHAGTVGMTRTSTSPKRRILTVWFATNNLAHTSSQLLVSQWKVSI
jgi:hypothetical protein